MTIADWTPTQYFKTIIIFIIVVVIIVIIITIIIIVIIIITTTIILIIMLPNKIPFSPHYHSSSSLLFDSQWNLSIPPLKFRATDFTFCMTHLYDTSSLQFERVYLSI